MEGQRALRLSGCFLWRVLLLQSLLALLRIETAVANEVQTLPDVYSVSSGTEPVFSASMENLTEDADESEAQVHVAFL